MSHDNSDNDDNEGGHTHALCLVMMNPFEAVFHRSHTTMLYHNMIPSVSD